MSKKIIFSMEEEQQMLALHSKGFNDHEILHLVFADRFCVTVIRKWRLKNHMDANYFSVGQRSNLSKAKKEPGLLHISKKLRAQECLKSLEMGWSVPLSEPERKIAQKLINHPEGVVMDGFHGTNWTRKVLAGMIIKKWVIRKPHGKTFIYFHDPKKLNFNAPVTQRVSDKQNN